MNTATTVIRKRARSSEVRDDGSRCPELDATEMVVDHRAGALELFPAHRLEERHVETR